MPSEKDLNKILGIHRPWYKRVYDLYIDYPLLADFLLGGVGIMVYILSSLLKNPLFNIDVSSLQDILNELISTSLSLGGFVLAALAIIASIQLGVKNKNPKDAETGKEFFYNSRGYKRVINIYSTSCFTYLALFLIFTSARGVSAGIELKTLLYIIIAGVVILSSSFIRCVIILWGLMRIR